jgi:hypothetical protein
MADRRTREALLQDELMNSVRMGAILQEQGNSEREYQLGLQRQVLSQRALEAELTKQQYIVDEEKKVADARRDYTIGVGSIDYLAPDAEEKHRELVTKYQPLMPAAEFESMNTPIAKRIGATSEFVNNYKLRTGIAPVVGEDGRYDLAQSAIEEKKLAAAYESGLRPTTQGALERVEHLKTLPLSQKLVYGQEHEVADQMVRWAVQNDLLTYDDLSKLGSGLYITSGVQDQKTTFDGSGTPIGTTQPRRSDHVYDLRAVEGVKLSNGRTLSSLFKEVQDTKELGVQNAASGEVVGKEISMLMDEGKLLQRLVHGDPEADIKAMDKTDPTYNAYTARLGVVMDRVAQLQGAKASFDAGGAGTYSPKETIIQGNQGALARKGMTTEQIETLVSAGLLDREGAKAVYEGKEIQFGNSIITLK